MKQSPLHMLLGEGGHAGRFHAGRDGCSGVVLGVCASRRSHVLMVLAADPQHSNFDREAFLEIKRTEAEVEGWEFHAPLDLSALPPEEQAKRESLFAD